METMGTKLAAALVKAQAQMGGAKKDTANPFFKSKYADLSSIDAAIGEAAGKNGLAYIQISHEREDAAAIETIIVHESGETYSCGITSCRVSKADAQGFGSAMTYARRYSLAAAFGVCPEDDDGNAAAKAAPKGTPITPNDPGKDFWAKAEGEEKQFLENSLLDLQTMLGFGDDQKASKYFYGLKDQEEALAVWSRLNSKERAAIKKFKPDQAQ